MRRRYLTLLAGGCALLGAGYAAGWRASSHRQGTSVAAPDEVVMVVRDTVVIRAPAGAPVVRHKADSIVTRVAAADVTAAVAEPDSTGAIAADSVDVALPLTQSLYEGDGYRAWVSGHRASLDSIELRHTTVSVCRQEPPATRSQRRRWHLGLSAGYGMTPDGLRPMAGVTITYSLLSW